MPDQNYVEVTVSAKDDTGPGFASADAKAAAFSKVIDQTLRKEIAAHQAVASAETQHLKTAKLLADAEDVLAGNMGDAAREAENAARGFSMPVQPMGALVGAGVLLAPTLLSVGTGLGGLALAAAGSVGPVLRAAQATGGLRANMSRLDPEQRAAARSLLGLQGSYQQFEKALAPTVLKDFNAAIGAAAPLLHEVEPVAKATGDALAGVLGQVGAEFRSGEWQQFFGFMAQNAGPDLHLLASSFVNLAHALPPLVEGLKPVNDELLQLLDLTTRGMGATAQFQQRAQQAAHSSSLWGHVLHDVGGAWQQVLTQMNPAITKLGPLVSQIDKAAQSSGRGSASVHRLGMVTGDLIHPLGTASAGMARLASGARAMGSAEKVAAGEASTLTGALAKGLGPLEAYIGATLTQANDGRALEKALKASGDKIGYNTGAQRASFGAAQTYIAHLSATASAAVASHQGINKQITSIQNALPMLEGVTGKTAAYNAELSLLKGYLDKLRAEADITKYVTIVTRDVRPGGYQEFHAAGGIVSGTAATGGLRSGRVLLGEHGPEAVDLPPGAMVHSNPDTQAMLSGASGGSSPIVLEFHIPAGVPLGQEFWTAFANGIRTRGGSKDIVTRKVVFA